MVVIAGDVHKEGEEEIREVLEAEKIHPPMSAVKFF